ncbi:MAG: response regulator transcription factor [Alphaproteobacteria bacterium]|nr:response regulator transcription factor [Alphaproteobacteria bacterium]
MIVFLDYINDAANRSCLVGVRRMLPGTPLVVVPRTLSALLTTQLLADGAQAVIPPDADPSAVFSVLQLAARGGAYAPPQPAAAAPAESAERADHAGAHRSSARWANRSVTDQQQQILSLIRRGHTNKEISRTLNISHNTTKNHVMRLMRKFKASNRAMLAAMTNES